MTAGPSAPDHLHPNARKVLEAAAAADLGISVVEYPEGTRTAEEAATAVGCDVSQIVKSLVFDAGGRLVLALTSGARRVDPAALARVAGVERVGRADAEQVRAATGFPIGGVPPLGSRTSLDTFLDPTLLDHDVVWAAAGTPRHVFAVDPRALARATGATLASFTA